VVFLAVFPVVESGQVESLAFLVLVRVVDLSEEMAV